MINNYDDSPTTGWHQRMAGEGRHSDYSAQRRASRQPQFHPVPPQKVAPPLAGLNDAVAFADEVGRGLQRNVGRDMLVGGVLGALLVRAVQNRGRR